MDNKVKLTIIIVVQVVTVVGTFLVRILEGKTNSETEAMLAELLFALFTQRERPQT